MRTHHIFVIVGSLACGLLLLGASLSTFTDDFAAGINAANWVIENPQALYDIDDSNSEVRFSKSTGGQYAFQYAKLVFNKDIPGDFDARIDFRNASIDRVDGSPANQIQFNALFGSQFFAVVRDDDVVAGHNHHVFVGPPQVWQGAQANTATSGTLRITRSGSLSEVAEALRYLGEGHARGKVVITVSPGCSAGERKPYLSGT